MESFEKRLAYSILSFKTNMWVNQHDSILVSRKCPGAVHRKVLDKEAADGPVYNYFSLRCSRITKLMLEYCYSAHDLELVLRRMHSNPQCPLIVIKKRFALQEVGWGLR